MKSVFLLFFTFINFTITAQLQTYYGVKFGVIKAKRYSSNSINQFHSNIIFDGWSADAFVRKKITKILSVELGYSFRLYGFAYKLNEKTEIFMSQAYAVHSVPAFAELDIRINKKISGYLTNGFLLCADNYDPNSNHGITSFRDTDLNAFISTEWTYLRKSRYFAYYKTGFGCRINLINRLYLEPGFNYVFRFYDIRKYNLTVSYDTGETKTYIFKDKGNYMNFNIGISYSFQKK